MQTKQTITIIGATGNMGSSLSKSLSKGNYRLLLHGKDLAKLQSLEQDIRKLNPSADIEAIDCSYNGCWEADIIISAIPYQAEKEFAERIRQVATQKIVISITNPLNETYDGLITGSDTSAADELQSLLPNSKIVKAFNTTFARDFLQPVIEGNQVDCFIAGNDKEAVETVTELVTTVGFNPIHAGDLSTSRTLEHMQLLLIQLNNKYHYKGLAGWKVLHQ